MVFGRGTGEENGYPIVIYGTCEIAHTAWLAGETGSKICPRTLKLKKTTFFEFHCQNLSVELSINIDSVVDNTYHTGASNQWN